jgi:hypothetical protein
MDRYRADDSGSPTEFVVEFAISNCVLAHVRRVRANAKDKDSGFRQLDILAFFS